MKIKSGPGQCAFQENAQHKKPQKPRPILEFPAEWPAPFCGVDEAGRGPWAGPVVAAAVILPASARALPIDDSKRLSPAARQDLAHKIYECAEWGLGFASVEEIDRLNILRATGLAMRRAVAALPRPVVLAVVDGNFVPDLGVPARAEIGGDGRIAAIAAASILAKTARDEWMVAADTQFPSYGFDAHKGYGVPAHRAALDRFGPCALHRQSFRPVAEAIRKRSTREIAGN